MYKKYISRPIISQSIFLTLNSIIANCLDLQHRPRYPEPYVFKDDSDPDLLHDISESEDVNSQEVVSALVMNNVEHELLG